MDGALNDPDFFTLGSASPSPRDPAPPARANQKVDAEPHQQSTVCSGFSPVCRAHAKSGFRRRVTLSTWSKSLLITINQGLSICLARNVWPCQPFTFCLWEIRGNFTNPKKERVGFFLGILWDQYLIYEYQYCIPGRCNAKDTRPGKRLHNYGKSQFLMGKSTISMAIFNRKLLNYQRVVLG
jgi:hypothetical protein